VGQVLAEHAAGLEWCGQLETAVSNAVVGKVLCVCAAAAIALEALEAEAAPGDFQGAAGALKLLGLWIDDPTDERFNRICGLIFGEGGQAAECDLPHVVWWALRTATSSVGNYEAGWALEATCDAAVRAGFHPVQLRRIAERELLSRLRQSG
jgi:hypothetical protein